MWNTCSISCYYCVWYVTDIQTVKSTINMSETSAILSESRSILYGQSELANDSENVSHEKQITLSSIHFLLTQMNSKLANIELKSDSLDSRLFAIEQKMASFNELQASVNSLNCRVGILDEEIVKVKKDMTDFDRNMTALGDVFDNVKESTERNTKLMTDNKTLTDKCIQSQRIMERDLVSIKEANESLQNSVTDLKARSMRDNLIFSGIPEERHEDTEAVLQEFIQKKYKLDYEVPFERVHRMGKWKEYSSHPRNIVAKFTYFKDRELIRTRAPQKLHKSNVWVNEQFPPEIEEKRRKLYPVLRQAKKDHKKVKLVRDVLYIDGQEYIPPIGSAPRAFPTPTPAQTRPASNQTTERQYTPQNPTKDDRQAFKRQRQGSTPDRIG